MRVSSGDGPRARQRGWFPKRELIVRSRGQVRFVTITSRVQASAAAAAVALLLAWVMTLGLLLAGHVAPSHPRLAGSAPAAAADTKKLEQLAADLQRRQDVIEKLVQGELGNLPQAPAADLVKTAPAPDKISFETTPAPGLAGIAARQIVFVDTLTRYADARTVRAEAKIRTLGLSPRTLVTREDRSAQGGPLLRLATAANGALDPRFRRLGESLARMSALARGMRGIPQVLPASADYISSGFGFRSDPFTGEGAFHAGLDFKGPVGAPIYAAAQGVIAFAGERSGYGNCIEIDHGHGLMTRYAHMSAFRVHVGEPVKAGQMIGAIGSTGRSTGPHLHFEVRIDDRAVNPRPFLEAGTKAFGQPS
ncbi:MAG: M23 family metallopeptidase [Novosphingobium sp.]|nr:M23 family metallopeptidase [Novosphingobium sp.]